MIVRKESNGEMLLLTQTDHSRLAGQFAAHWGNETFAELSPYESVTRAAIFHDFGYLRYETAPMFDPASGETPMFRQLPNDATRFEEYEWCFNWLLEQDRQQTALAPRGVRRAQCSTAHPAEPHAVWKLRRARRAYDRHRSLIGSEGDNAVRVSGAVGVAERDGSLDHREVGALLEEQPAGDRHLIGLAADRHVVGFVAEAVVPAVDPHRGLDLRERCRAPVVEAKLRDRDDRGVPLRVAL